MDIHFDNVNLSSNNGPNSFAAKLAKYLITELYREDIETYGYTF